LVYNIEGDKWQMTYEVLEALLDNLKTEEKSNATNGKENR
jgi:hypothetical protein